MKRRIRIVSLLLSLVKCSTQCIPAFACSESIGRVSDIPHTTIYMDVRSMTSEERDCAFQNHMSEATAAVLAQHGTRGNLGYTETNYGSTTRHTVKGYPGDQPPGAIAMVLRVGQFILPKRADRQLAFQSVLAYRTMFQLILQYRLVR